MLAVHPKTAPPCSLRYIMTDPHGNPVAPAPATQKWRVTPAQKERLLKAFDEEPYPNPSRKAVLAAQLGVTGTQVSKWFQHRRESLTRLGQFKAQYNRSRRTDRELAILQRAYEEDSYPSADRLAQLQAELVNVTAKQIKLWFKHRRKQSRHRSQQGDAVNAQKQQQSPQSAAASAKHLPGASEYHAVTTNSAAAAAVASGSNVYPPFSHLELMALRGALCMSKQFPATQGIQALATFLGRPLDQLHSWFAEEIRGGFFWNYLADIDSSVLAGSVPSSTASVAAGGNAAAAGPFPVSFQSPNMGQPALQHGSLRTGPGINEDANRVKPSELKAYPSFPVQNKMWPLPMAAKGPERDGQRPSLVPFQQQPVVLHADPYAFSHATALAPQPVSDPAAAPVQDKNLSAGFTPYQPVWYCAPGTPQAQLGYGNGRAYIPPSTTTAALSPMSGEGLKK